MPSAASAKGSAMSMALFIVPKTDLLLEGAGFGGLRCNTCGWCNESRVFGIAIVELGIKTAWLGPRRVWLGTCRTAWLGVPSAGLAGGDNIIPGTICRGCGVTTNCCKTVLTGYCIGGACST